MADQNSKTIRASRATISIGDIPVNVYQLPDGSYRLAGRNVTDAVGEHHSTLARFHKVKSLKALPGNASSLTQVKSDSGETFIPVSIEDAMDYWLSRVGSNDKAKAIARALMSESIERRADRQFGIQRSESERDERLKIRMQGKLTRTSLEDAIYQYIQRHPETSKSYQQWLYKNATDKMITQVWGKNRKKLALERGIDTRNSLRDIMESPELATIDRIEDLMSRLIIQQDMEPLAAATEAVERTLTHGLFAS